MAKKTLTEGSKRGNVKIRTVTKGNVKPQEPSKKPVNPPSGPKKK